MNEQSRTLYPIAKSSTHIWTAIGVSFDMMSKINKEQLQKQLDKSPSINKDDNKSITIITPQVYKVGKLQFTLSNLVSIRNKNVGRFIMDLFTMNNEWGHDKLSLQSTISLDGIRKYSYLSEHNILKHIEQVLDNPPYFIILKHSLIDFNKMINKNKN